MMNQLCSIVKTMNLIINSNSKKHTHRIWIGLSNIHSNDRARFTRKQGKLNLLETVAKGGINKKCQ